MSYIFYNCLSLSSLPDISKWNTNDVEDMSGMFWNCIILSLLPDISKWNTNKVNNMSDMLDNCILLLYIPNLQIINFYDTISENFEFEEDEINDNDINHKKGNNNK